MEKDFSQCYYLTLTDSGTKFVNLILTVSIRAYFDFAYLSNYK
jgi:hypothetical protein